MKLEYENDILRIENADGLRWQLSDVEKPQFTFDYEALHVSHERAMRRIGSAVHALSEGEIQQVKAFIEQAPPPSWATFQTQIIADLRLFAHGLIKSIVTQLEYDGLLDVMITGREGSTDLYAEEARRVMAYVDSVWNAFHGLAAQIRNTPQAELKSIKQYATMMPVPPHIEHFSGVVPEGLFDGAHDNC